MTVPQTTEATSSSKGRESYAEAALVAAVRQGDRQAFEALVVPCQAKILRWLTRLTGDRPSAEELLQESLFKAFVAIDSFRGEASFATWLASIARNTYFAWRKSQNKRPDNLPLDAEDEAMSMQGSAWADAPLTPEEELWQKELSAVVNASLENLAAPIREAFQQRELTGLSYDEIAENQQVPVGTVRSRIHRAREAIAHDLKQIMEPA